MSYKASLACQIRMSIRCKNEMSYQILTDIFKKKIPLKQEYQRYLYGFFEECYPGLIKKYMTEQNVTRNEIIDIFNLLPEQGEKYKFREALSNGKF